MRFVFSYQARLDCLYQLIDDVAANGPRKTGVGYGVEGKAYKSQTEAEKRSIRPYVGKPGILSHCCFRGTYGPARSNSRSLRQRGVETTNRPVKKADLLGHVRWKAQTRFPSATIWKPVKRDLASTCLRLVGKVKRWHPITFAVGKLYVRGCGWWMGSGLHLR